MHRGGDQGKVDDGVIRGKKKVGKRKETMPWVRTLPTPLFLPQRTYLVGAGRLRVFPTVETLRVHVLAEPAADAAARFRRGAST